MKSDIAILWWFSLFYNEWSWTAFQMSVGNFNFCKFMSFIQLANGLLGFFLINLPVYSGKHTTVLCLENIFFYYSSIDVIYWFIYLLACRKFKVLCCQFISIFLDRSWDLFPVLKGLLHSEIINKLTHIFFYIYGFIYLSLHLLIPWNSFTVGSRGKNAFFSPAPNGQLCQQNM